MVENLVEGENARWCLTCGTLKHFDGFNKKKDGKYGYDSKCKDCVSDYMKEYHKDNAERINKKSRQYHKENRDRILKRQKKYRKENKEAIAESKKKWAEENREHLKKYKKEYYEENKDRLIKQGIKRKVERHHNDLNFRLKNYCRKRISIALKDNKKLKSSRKLIGCTIKELRKHIQDQFEDGMTWDNYGYDGWHIDHVIPLSNFDLSNEYSQSVAFHYSNCQPLWAEDNFSKYNTVPDLGIKIDKEFLDNHKNNYTF